MNLTNRLRMTGGCRHSRCHDMSRSLNEIEMTLVKCARGVGQPTGVAEDLARAGVWLCRLGCDGVSLVLAGFEANDNRDRPLEVGGKQTMLSATHPVHSALAGIDFALNDLDTLVRLPAGLPVPEIIVGLAGVAADQFDRQFTISIATGEVIEVGKSGVSAMPSTAAVEQALEIVASRSEPDDPACKLIDDRPQIDDVVWERALEYAALTYVPASDESRASGAGAGLTDND